METQFGFLPQMQDFSVGDITVSTLPGLDEARKGIEESGQVEKGWIYSPPKRVRQLLGGEVEMPYPARVFGLPRTHTLAHATATDPEHLAFLVWMFGFIKGIRLTTTEAGFLDATPVKVGELHDMVWLEHGERQALVHADALWMKHGSRISKGLSGVVHSLFLSHKPHLLDFEELLFVYTAIDGCHAVWSAMNGRKPTSVSHGKRIEALCSELKTWTPDWIRDIVDFRNDALHEALFLGEPLGFAIFRDLGPKGRSRNVILEMQCLVTRFVCAILGLPCADYISSPVNTHQRFGVEMS